MTLARRDTLQRAAEGAGSTNGYAGFKFEAIGVGDSEQFNLFEATPEVKLKMELLGVIEKAPTNGIEYSKVEDWAYDRTSGVERDIKKALVELEGECKVEIQRQPGQQKKTVVKGAKIKPAFHRLTQHL